MFKSAHEEVKDDANEKFRLAQQELLRMRKFALTQWGMEPLDIAYPDLAYAMGDPPVRLDD